MMNDNNYTTTSTDNNNNDNNCIAFSSPEHIYIIQVLFSLNITEVDT